MAVKDSVEANENIFFEQFKDNGGVLICVLLALPDDGRLIYVLDLVLSLHILFRPACTVFVFLPFFVRAILVLLAFAEVLT